MARDDGGPAFPRTVGMTTHDAGAAHTMRFSAESAGGMSLRDYFAAMAVSAAIEHELALRSATILPGPFRYHEVAGSCYAIADAMLKEREK